ncbi:hypothetical protein INT43_004265 [Umbelopsis isabellina]|uniref:Uncharacterized protein n=1 Tax=Mortierella isabellina TaxID=91625 RepID=A0A8H7PIL3_MORIS|nr:hypothetical protein INT43_004265 [Umbelopsis isabellina]
MISKLPAQPSVSCLYTLCTRKLVIKEDTDHMVEISKEEYYSLQAEVRKLQMASDNLTASFIFCQSWELPVSLPDKVSNLPYLAILSPISIMSIRRCSVHLKAVIDEHSEEIWKQALFYHYPHAATLPSKHYLERFAQVYIWKHAKQVSREFKPQDIGLDGEHQDQLEHSHGHQNSCHKPDLSLDNSERLDLGFLLNSPCYSQETFSCGIIPYERWIPIPNSYLCAHVCRPAINLHSGGRRNNRGRQNPYDQVFRVFDKRFPGKGFTPKDSHENLISDIAIDNQTLVTTSLDGSVKVWNIFPDNKEPVKLAHTLQSHNGWVNAVDIKNNIIVSGGSDGNLHFWNTTTGKLFKTYRNLFAAYGFGVLSVSLHQHSDLVGFGSVFGPYYVYDHKKDELLHTLDEPLTFEQYSDFVGVKHQEYSSVIRITCTTILTTSKTNEQICVWSVATGDLLYRIHAGGNIHSFQVSLSEGILMCTMCDGRIRIWNANRHDRGWRYSVEKQKNNIRHGLTWIYEKWGNENVISLL